MTVVKTSFNLPESFLKDLKEMADASDVSMADVVRRAIATEKFLMDAQSKGGKILIEEPDKSFRHVVFR